MEWQPKQVTYFGAVLDEGYMKTLSEKDQDVYREAQHLDHMTRQIRALNEVQIQLKFAWCKEHDKLRPTIVALERAMAELHNYIAYRMEVL